MQTTQAGRNFMNQPKKTLSNSWEVMRFIGGRMLASFWLVLVMEAHSSSLDSPLTSKVLLIQLMEVGLQPTRTVSTTLSTGCGKYQED